MTDLNQCTFTGRLGAVPEIRRTQSGDPIANMRLACSDTWRDKNSGERKEKTEWVSVVVFGDGLCKIVEAYLSKGSKILVQGKMQTRKWTDQSGNDRYSTEIVLHGFDAKLIMLDGAPSDAKKKHGEPKHDSYGNAAPPDLDDDIPF